MKMSQNNVFTIAKRNVEGQDMLYQSLKLTNGNWVLNELKIQPGNPNITVRKLNYQFYKKCKTATILFLILAKKSFLGGIKVYIYLLVYLPILCPRKKIS